MPCLKYQKHHHLIYSCKYHVIFCPKHRKKILIGKTADIIKRAVISKQDQYGYKIIEMEVMPDHVHLLLDVSPRDDIAKITDMIKGYTSFMISKEFGVFRKPVWAPSKFISSVGAVTLDVVKKYIEAQK
ncbi:MAG: IS200/IS605 family transposase [Candidatus Nitrosotenuis sp.]